jgi:hypothetical protein
MLKTLDRLLKEHDGFTLKIELVNDGGIIDLAVTSGTTTTARWKTRQSSFLGRPSRQPPSSPETPKGDKWGRSGTKSGARTSRS